MIGKRAQIGETTTWIVATIIITVILAASIFIVSLNNKNRGFVLETHPDLFFVKSATSFLEKDLNLQTIKDAVKLEDYTLFEEKFTEFLNRFKTGTSGWNVELRVDGENKKNVKTLDVKTQGCMYEKRFEFLFDYNKVDKKVELYFCKECIGNCPW